MGNTFTDSDGDTYVVAESSQGTYLSIRSETYKDEVVFFKADATKIIALIAEAAK